MEEEVKSFSFPVNRPIELRAYNYFTGEMMYGPSPDQPSTSWLLGLGDMFPRMEFTGELDEEKTKIWEGDIVENGIYTGIIEWRRGAFIINYQDGHTDLLGEELEEIKVVGHIYQKK